MTLGAISRQHGYLNGNIRENGQGQFEMYVRAHAALTAKTPYKVYHDGNRYVTAAIADEAVTYIVGVPEKAIASGKDGWVVIGGIVESVVVPSATYTLRHGMKVHDGVLTSMGANFAFGANEFAVIMATHGSATTALNLELVQHVTGPRLATT